jgi:hypothetical protein
LVLGGGLALGLLRRRGRAVGRAQHCQRGVRAYRVRGGQPGQRLCQTAEKDYLLIRTSGVAAVFGGQGGPGPVMLEETVASELRPGELVLVEAGQVVPCNG